MKIGLNDTIVRAYSEIAYLRHSGIEKHKLRGTTASFNVTTQQEYNRFRNLMGEKDVIEDILDEVESDDIVFDVGANVGTYTCFLAKRLSRDQVIAVEPHPINISALRSNLELNKTDARIVDQALSDSNGSAELAVRSEEAGEGQHSLATADQEDTIEVDQITGDNLLTEVGLPTPTLMKIDVEGAELKVLQGLDSTLSRPERKVCYVEIHPHCLPRYGGSKEDIDSFMDSRGFSSTTIANRADKDFVKYMK